MSSIYRGSQEHKNRPVKGLKGTLCPERLNEKISAYTNADWNRGLHRLARVRPDDFARMLQADVSPTVALRIAIANRDLPGKILKVLTGR